MWSVPVSTRRRRDFGIAVACRIRRVYSDRVPIGCGINARPHGSDQNRLRSRSRAVTADNYVGCSRAAAEQIPGNLSVDLTAGHKRKRRGLSVEADRIHWPAWSPAEWWQREQSEEPVDCRKWLPGCRATPACPFTNVAAFTTPPGLTAGICANTVPSAAVAIRASMRIPVFWARVLSARGRRFVGSGIIVSLFQIEKCSGNFSVVVVIERAGALCFSHGVYRVP